MKTVIFVRHAKSSWSVLGLSDHDRPLNDRGKRDAPAMAMVLKARAEPVDLLLSSTAKRAHATAKYFRKELGLDKNLLVLKSQLYHSYPGEMASIIKKLSDDYQTIALFAHNPGLTMMANDVAGEYIDNVPTTGVFRVNCPVDRWADWSIAGSQRTAFWYPKMFL